MKKATLVLATLVAFLLSSSAFAARNYVDMPSMKSIFAQPGSATLVGDGVNIFGPTINGEIILASESISLPVVTSATVSSSSISGLAKNVIKGGAGLVAVAAAGYALDELLDGVDWVIHDGSVVKINSGGDVSTDPSSGEYYYINGGSDTKFSSASSACAQRINQLASSQGYKNPQVTGLTPSSSGSTYICTYTYSFQGNNNLPGTPQTITRGGTHCPAGSSFSLSTGACTGAATYAPLADSDYSILDGFVKNKDGTWQRDLTNQLCGGAESCYEALSPTTQLSGPSTVTGKPQTVTTTGPSGTSTTVKTPSASVTYGPNYYDYSPTTTTTTTGGSGSTTTTDDTDTSLPQPPNLFGGANDDFGGVIGGIPGTSSVTSPIPYMPWWSFSQSCSEITFVIPVYGAVTTAFCPIYKQYIWPTLYFIFAVFTWVHCWGIWRGTVLRVRAF